MPGPPDPQYVRVPRQLEVLLRDLLAHDNTESDAIDLGEELERALGSWLDVLRAKRQESIEATQRSLRRELRRSAREI